MNANDRGRPGEGGPKVSATTPQTIPPTADAGEELTRREQADLQKHEATIRAGLKSFAQVGTAIQRIRDERLYRATHATFEDYLRERWGISRARGYQLIEAAATMAAVSTMVDTPITNERVARAVHDVLKEHGAARAGEVLRDVAASGTVTARAVKERATHPDPHPYRGNSSKAKRSDYLRHHFSEALRGLDRFINPRNADAAETLEVLADMDAPRASEQIRLRGQLLCDFADQLDAQQLATRQAAA